MVDDVSYLVFLPLVPSCEEDGSGVWIWTGTRLEKKKNECQLTKFIPCLDPCSFFTLQDSAECLYCKWQQNYQYVVFRILLTHSEPEEPRDYRGQFCTHKTSVLGDQHAIYSVFHDAVSFIFHLSGITRFLSLQSYPQAPITGTLQNADTSITLERWHFLRFQDNWRFCLFSSVQSFDRLVVGGTWRTIQQRSSSSLGVLGVSFNNITLVGRLVGGGC